MRLLFCSLLISLAIGEPWVKAIEDAQAQRLESKIDKLIDANSSQYLNLLDRNSQQDGDIIKLKLETDELSKEIERLQSERIQIAGVSRQQGYTYGGVGGLLGAATVLAIEKIILKLIDKNDKKNGGGKGQGMYTEADIKDAYLRGAHDKD